MIQRYQPPERSDVPERLMFCMGLVWFGILLVLAAAAILS
jgi:hypothetical protein